MTRIVLDWPPRILLPNEMKKSHWGPVSRATKKVRQDAYVQAMLHGAPQDMTGPLHVTLTLRYPPRSRADEDAVKSALKPAFDGIADYIGVDDRHWRFTGGVHRGERCKGGCVIVELEEAA